MPMSLAEASSPGNGAPIAMWSTRRPTGAVQQGPPSFRTIAHHLTANEVRAFLTHPHGAMPDLALTRSEIDDLIGYIETLR